MCAAATATVLVAGCGKDKSGGMEPTISVVDVSLDRISATLDIGEKTTLLAVVTPDEATDKSVVWSSDDPSVASVDESGEVTALTVGTATITATTNDGGKTAGCLVTVVNSANLDDFGTLSIPASNIFDVHNATEWSDAVAAIDGGGNDNNYIINIVEDLSLPGTNAFTFGAATGIRVSIRGERTIGLSSVGNLLIGVYADQTVILREVNLEGLTDNDSPLVFIQGGEFIMRSGNVLNNRGGGVYVNYGGSFTMTGGEISGNGANSYGGGVYVGACDFAKTGPSIIYGNTFSIHVPGDKNNTVISAAGGKGHAVFVYDSNKYRDATAGEGDDMSWNTGAGTWTGFEN
ncbi:hypothetical protein FACS1894159_11600 [Bacteroidia bacterium]|nr:hypothetical protein FACS1894159_11600 [Bacteroidia bacterium]